MPPFAKSPDNHIDGCSVSCFWMFANEPLDVMEPLFGVTISWTTHNPSGAAILTQKISVNCAFHELNTSSVRHGISLLALVKKLASC